jgi:hypothetical protein
VVVDGVEVDRSEVLMVELCSTTELKRGGAWREYLTFDGRTTFCVNFLTFVSSSHVISLS